MHKIPRKTTAQHTPDSVCMNPDEDHIQDSRAKEEISSQLNNDTAAGTEAIGR